jgi:ParB-like chromosome segregation protein Spo0J
MSTKSSLLGEIQHISPSKLKENPHQVRTHPERQIERLTEAIRQFGFLIPIVTSFEVLAGHGRLEAARQLKLKRVP